MHDMTACVRRASGKRAAVPRWNGGRMPLSSTLADAVLQQLALADQRRATTTPEMQCVRPLLEIQQRWSALPTPDTLLAEALQDRARAGTCSCIPFAGRQVHLGLANLIAWRVAQHAAAHVLDRGQRLRLRTAQCHRGRLAGAAAAGAGGRARQRGAGRDRARRQRTALLHEVLASLNATELARRRFREIARIVGPGLPGLSGREAKQPAAAGVVVAVLRGVPQVRPGNRLLHAGRGRAAGAGARNRPPAGQPGAHARRSGWCCARSPSPRPSPFR